MLFFPATPLLCSLVLLRYAMAQRFLESTSDSGLRDGKGCSASWGLAQFRQRQVGGPYAKADTHRVTTAHDIMA